MQHHNTHILCTAPLPGELAQKATDAGIVIDIVPLIQINFFSDSQVVQRVRQVPGHSFIVFTSSNAVTAVAAIIGNASPEWHIYAIGQKTAKMAQAYFGENSVAGTADNAADLAKVILQHGQVQKITFFCGDKRRDDLPLALLKEGVLATEIEVYETILTPREVEGNYDGIMFFSPSAVESYFDMNKINPETVLFAIGHTTAGAINRYTGYKNKIIISVSPSKEQLISQVIAHYGRST